MRILLNSDGIPTELLQEIRQEFLQEIRYEFRGNSQRILVELWEFCKACWKCYRKILFFHTEIRSNQSFYILFGQNSNGIP